jgi:hypothetical protein
LYLLEGVQAMAQYLILIYESEDAWADASPEEAGRMMQAHEAFGRDHAAVLRGGNALHPTGTATAMRREPSGGFALTDGPFAETKEALGGYYLIEVDDLDQALAVARQVPAPFGGVEVRPVRTFD